MGEAAQVSGVIRFEWGRDQGSIGSGFHQTAQQEYTSFVQVQGPWQLSGSQSFRKAAKKSDLKQLQINNYELLKTIKGEVDDELKEFVEMVIGSRKKAV